MFPDVPWHVLAIVPIIVLAAYSVFGATGFGSSIIAVPALAHAFPLTFGVPLVTALDGAATITASRRQWRDATFDELKRILPPAFVGVALGTTVLVSLPRAPAMLALGTFVAAYGVWQLVGAHRMSRANAWWSVPIGVVGGVFSVLFGTGGPIYIVYLSARIQDKTVLRATSSLLLTVIVWTRIVVFVATGLLLDGSMLALAALMVPIMFAGLHVGERLHRTLARAGVVRLIASVLIGNGLLLILRAIAMVER